MKVNINRNRSNNFKFFSGEAIMWEAEGLEPKRLLHFYKHLALCDFSSQLPIFLQFVKITK